MAAVLSLAPFAIPTTAVAQTTVDICGRTPAVRAKILDNIPGVTDCAVVTDTQLAAITGNLALQRANLTALAAGDFAGLTSLTALTLGNNGLSTLPDGVFAGLSSLERLRLNNNGLSTLPDGVFDGRSSLTQLWLNGNDLSTLPDGVFAGLSSLTELKLSDNPLSTLPDEVFAGLSSLLRLQLNNNGLSTLPDGVFDGRSSLTQLQLNDNGLSTLPDGVFDGLSSLTQLQLSGNPGAPFSPTADARSNVLTVSPGGGEVRLNGSSGGAWGTNVTYGWVADPANGVTFDDAASATPVATIGPQDVGAAITFTLTVTGRGGTNGIATGADDATVTVALDADVCGRTPAVSDALVAAVGASSCAAVTNTHLAGITGTLRITTDSLAAGDFAGLTSLDHLYLTNGALAELPVGAFDGLSQLESLTLTGNQLATLPAGAFRGLPELEFLYLQDNSPLTTLPARVFAELSSLTSLRLDASMLRTLDSEAFAGLTSLTSLRLEGNRLRNPPDGVFEPLTALETLNLSSNGLRNLDAGDFAGLRALTTLKLGSNDLQNLPAGVFEPLTALTTLELANNPGAPFSPAAVALPDAGTVSSAGGSVTLEGRDDGAWGTNVTYGWSQTSGPTSGVSLDDAASAMPVVTIPALTVGDELVFTLTVTGRGGIDGISPGAADATVTVTVPPPDDPTLSALTVNDGTNDLTLGPTPFAPDTLGYTASVAHAVEEVTLTATVNDIDARVSAVTLRGNAIADSDFTDGITIPSLLVGANEIVVTVTAEDTVTTQPYTVTVTRAANSAPTASDGSVTTDEDVAYTFAAAEFNFVDSDAGDELASVTVVTLPAAGGLALDGTAVTADQVVPRADIDADKLVYTPPANANGTSYASLTFRVSDGKDESASPYTMTVDVTPVNDAATGRPTISGTAEVRQPLTAATTGIVDVDGLTGVAYDYQWIRVDDDGASNATDIAGETAATYAPVETDIGKQVKVKVSFTDDGRTDEERTSDAYPANGTIEAQSGGVCGRTRAVRDALVAAVVGVNDCGAVTDNRLAGITGNLIVTVDSLAVGDFAGLTSLEHLYLTNGALAELPVGAFDGLSQLESLTLTGNQLATLPAGAFRGLPELEFLYLQDNSPLTTLPARVFAELSSLTSLRLDASMLRTLDSEAFAGLTSLTSLRRGRRLALAG